MTGRLLFPCIGIKHFFNIDSVHNNLQDRTDVENWKSDKKAELIRSQQLEKANLEKECIATEKQKMSDLLIKHSQIRNDALDEMNAKLAKKTKGNLSDDEVRLNPCLIKKNMKAHFKITSMLSPHKPFIKGK